MKLVAIGGGTGLSTLLRGIKEYPYDITAIVTMTDDGASSGRLRKSLGILPPGDIRKCIAALSEDETGLTELFEYRYKTGFGLKGHSVGNLLISALHEKTGSFELAVEEMSKILNIQGRVLPATLEDARLVGVFEDGREVVGQMGLVKYGYKHKLTKVKLLNKIRTNPRALAAISEADVIVIGPGSLYTSVLPNFLQAKMVKAVNDSSAKKIYVCNVSTERGETTGYTAQDHVSVLKSYGVVPDLVLVNNKNFSEKSGDGFVTPVIYTGNNELYHKVDLIDDNNHLYHDNKKLAELLSKIVKSLR